MTQLMTIGIAYGCLSKHAIRVSWSALIVHSQYAAGRQSCSCVTPRVMLGPYYSLGAPPREQICPRSMATRNLTVTGQVLGSNCQPIPFAEVDVWQGVYGLLANGQGKYSNFGSGRPAWECRGVTRADNNGYYRFSTVEPGRYTGRPIHIHVKVRASGYRELTTQFYFDGDPLNSRGDSSMNPCTHVDVRGDQGLRNVVLRGGGSAGWRGQGTVPVFYQPSGGQTTPNWAPLSPFSPFANPYAFDAAQSAGQAGQWPPNRRGRSQRGGGRGRWTTRKEAFDGDDLTDNNFAEYANPADAVGTTGMDGSAPSQAILASNGETGMQENSDRREQFDSED